MPAGRWTKEAASDRGMQPSMSAGLFPSGGMMGQAILCGSFECAAWPTNACINTRMAQFGQLPPFILASCNVRLQIGKQPFTQPASYRRYSP